MDRATHFSIFGRQDDDGSTSIFVQEAPARQYLEASLGDSAATDADDRIMAYNPTTRDEDEDSDSPFHSGETSAHPEERTSLPQGSCEEAPKAVSHDPGGWRIHRTTADLPADRPEAVANDSWIPDKARLGLRDPPPEDLHAKQPIYVYPAPPRQETLPMHRDAYWLLSWIGSLLFVVASGIWASLEPVPATVPDNIGASAFALLSSMPLLTLMTFLSLLAGASSMAYLLLVRTSVRALVIGGLVGAPVLLLIAAAWSWSGSWSAYGQEGSETQGEREALRWFSLGAVILAVFFAKLGYDRQARINRTVKVVELATEVLLAHPHLFVISLAMTAAFLVFTVPLVTITARLLLVAAAVQDSSMPTFLAVYTGFVWLWTLGVIRGVQRLAVAGTVGHWFFNRHQPQSPSPAALVGDAMRRAAGPSLGSACFAALILACLDSVALVLAQLRRLTRASRLPILLAPLALLAPFVAFATNLIEGMSSFALTFAGVTGESFISSSRGASALMTRTGTARAFDYLLLKLILNIVSLALSLIFGLAGYLSAATAQTHHHPGLVGLVCFAIPFWTIRSCSDVLGHAVDTIFICWSLDIDSNQNHCTKAALAFGEPIGLELPR